MTDTATYDRLQKDVKAVKSDIAALTDQITDAINSFAGDGSQRRAENLFQTRAGANPLSTTILRARQRDDERGAGRG